MPMSPCRTVAVATGTAPPPLPFFPLARFCAPAGCDRWESRKVDPTTVKRTAAKWPSVGDGGSGDLDHPWNSRPQVCRSLQKSATAERVTVRYAVRHTLKRLRIPLYL